VAIELDERFVAVLKRVAPCAEVVRSDVLKTDIAAVLAGMDEPRCIVSNMPYNITGPLLGKVSECKSLIKSAVLMIQKEVGARVLAGPGTPDRGALSVSMQLQFSIYKVCDAKAGAFVPPPKVDSVVLEFVPRHEAHDLPKTLAVVKQGFRQPRKALTNNLPAAKGLVPDKVRPHELTNEQWVELARKL
jgi:16S rRNA (adenine1518-N6/adenine1519-N6)-dimethyltransferase